MEKILILSDLYYPKPLANGICVHELAKDLKNNGYEVHVVCFQVGQKTSNEQIDGIHIHRVKPRLFFKLREYGEKNIKLTRGKLVHKLAMFIQKFKRALFLPFSPMTSPIFINRYYQKTKNLHNNHEFSMIISIYNPVEAVVTGSLMKKKYPEIKHVVYVLDTLSNMKVLNNLKNKIERNRGIKLERYLYKNADIILNMKCHEQNHKDVRYDEFRNKMKIVDIPLLVKTDIKDISKEISKDKITMIYAGSIGYDRSPIYLFECIKRISSFDIQVDFYTRGGCQDIFNKYEKETNSAIINKGYIERSLLLEKLNTCDICISLGVKNSDMISAKIFEYMALGKPIIHLARKDNEVCIDYLKRYPLALIIKESSYYLNEDIQAIEEFILATQNKKIDIEDILLEFQMNTPKYTTDILINELKRG